MRTSEWAGDDGTNPPGSEKRTGWKGQRTDKGTDREMHSAHCVIVCSFPFAVRFSLYHLFLLDVLSGSPPKWPWPSTPGTSRLEWSRVCCAKLFRLDSRVSISSLGKLAFLFLTTRLNIFSDARIEIDKIAFVSKRSIDYVFQMLDD